MSVTTILSKVNWWDVGKRIAGVVTTGLFVDAVASNAAERGARRAMSARRKRSKGRKRSRRRN